MGWFTGSTTVEVSSTVYNLAGDIATRPNYLKTTVLGAVLSDADSIPETIKNAYLTGPGIRLRNFAIWARIQNPVIPGVTGTYDTNIGLNTGSITSGNSINNSVLAGQIPDGGGTVDVQSAFIAGSEFSYWADQYVAINNPSQLLVGYSSTYDQTANTITITYADLSTATFTPAGFDPFGSYLYATYTITIAGVWGTPFIFIYKKGSGNSTLDAFWAASSDLGSFLPFIPYRINNENVVDAYPTTTYPIAVKAIKKALNADYDTVTTAINANSSLSDIDYAYAVFGVCLNTQDNSAKKYLYDFFETILSEPGMVTLSDYGTWEAEWLAANASWTAWAAWAAGGMIGLEPTKIPYPTMPINSIAVTSNSDSVMDYDMVISWNYMYEETGTGTLFLADGITPANLDELWLQSTTTASYAAPTWGIDPTTGKYVMVSSGPVMTDGITISWQVTPTTWKRLTIIGLVHNNYIYEGNAVTILASDALLDSAESGFLIPLHEDIFRAMSLKDFTQMTTACCYLVFNSYTIVTTPWYETGWFQILLIVVIIVIAVLTVGAGAVGAAGGLLGSNAAIGAAILGSAASATMIAIVGAIVNALVAMVVVMIINKVAVLALGPELGVLIGSIVSLVTLQIGSGLAAGQSFSSIFSNLTKITSLISLTESVGNAISSFIKAGIQDTMGEITTYQNQENAQSNSIQDQANALFGEGTVSIDPSVFDSNNTTSSTSGMVMEPSAIFLSRTLMTGSDLADLTNSMISDFCSLTLNMDLLLSS